MGDQSTNSPDADIQLPDYLDEPGAGLSLLKQLLGVTDTLVLLLEGDDRHIAVASRSVAKLVDGPVQGKTFAELHETRGRSVDPSEVAFSCQLNTPGGPIPVTYQVRPVKLGGRELIMVIGRDIKELVAWRARTERTDAVDL